VRRAENLEAIPLAYLLTFSCYGMRLHGDKSGSVDRAHNIPGTPPLSPNMQRLQSEQKRIQAPAYEMDAYRRDITLGAIQEVCGYRGWSLLAAHVRSNHVHVVVHALVQPEFVMNDMKSYASRRLNECDLDTPLRKRWTRHGSTRYLWKPEQVEAAIRYVVDEQGKLMAVFEQKERQLLEENRAATVRERKPEQ
jgi:REP element-mobilizing transposase RayT